MGDFVKGRLEAVSEIYPQGVITGIRQHRATDRFTDAHPTFREARSLLAPERRRMAGIIVDVIYDYFLSQSWTGGHSQRRKFIARCHETLLERQSWLPANFTRILPTMIAEQWLESYSSIDGLSLTFRRISSRSQAITPVSGAAQDFLKSRKDFEKLFDTFFPDLLAFTEEWKKQERTSQASLLRNSE